MSTKCRHCVSASYGSERQLLCEYREKWEPLTRLFNGYKISVEAYCEALDRIAQSCDTSDDSLPEDVRKAYENYAETVPGLQERLLSAYENYAAVRARTLKDLRSGTAEEKRRARISVTKARSRLDKSADALSLSRETVCELIEAVLKNVYVPCWLCEASTRKRGDLPSAEGDFWSAHDVETRRDWEERLGVPIKTFLREFEQIYIDMVRCREINKQIVNAHMGQVEMWAAQYAARDENHRLGLSKDDFAGVARETLERAVGGYDPARGKSFYAYLKGSVNREMWNLVRRVKAENAGVSVNVLKDVDRMRRIRNRVLTHSGHLDPREEVKKLARLMNVDRSRIVQLKEFEGGMQSVSFKGQGNGDLDEAYVAERIIDQGMPDSSDCVSEEELRERRAEIVEWFTGSEREIVKRMLGMKVPDAHTLQKTMDRIYCRMREVSRKWCKLDEGLAKFAFRSCPMTLFLPGLSNGKKIDSWVDLFKEVCVRAGKCHAEGLQALATRKNAAWIDLRPQDGFAKISCSEGVPVYVSVEGEAKDDIIRHIIMIAEACGMTEAVLVFATGVAARRIFKTQVAVK